MNNIFVFTRRSPPRMGWLREGGDHRRRGSVLICVLVCLSIATALVTATIRTALQARHQVRTQHQLRQTELLLEAGVVRAVRKFGSEAEYTGERWDLVGDTIPGFDAVRVEIEVERSGLSGARRIHVVARLPTDLETSVKRSHVILADTHAASTKE